MTVHGRELRSTIADDGTLTLTLDDAAVGDPAEGEVVVRVEATPINPSDLAQLLGPADVASMKAGGTPAHPTLTFTVPEARMGAVKGRLGQALPVGNEGAGTVVEAGGKARDLIGRRVAMRGGGMYADYRRLPASDVVALPDGVSAAQGAAIFVNPLTALAFVDTARREGHTAIVHTAAASSLGQMLQKICIADGVPLVNVIRSEEQAAILREIGAVHVIDSRDDDFAAKLADAVAKTGATIAFDAIGGGPIGGQIVAAMERAAVARMTEFSRYGSSEFKQLYIYGALDPSPTTLNWLTYGFHWSVSGWLAYAYMEKVGPAIVDKLRDRVLAELTTTFATRYTRTIGLAEVLDPDTVRAYQRKATGEKFLIEPSKG